MRTVTTLLLVLKVVLLPVVCGAQSVDLSRGFTEPPAAARPHTWWHWMNGNVTREGITADLEAMKRVGLGGVQVFNVSESIPDGPAPFMSPQWRELFVFAVKEADRLGLEVCIHNCAGWSSSGGPWVKPEHAMQMVVTSERTFEGPRRITEALPQPETRHGYYRDIAVLAFPTPKSDARIKDIRVKAGYEYRYDQQPALDQYAADSVIAREGVRDITSSVKDGTLEWDAPAGSWTVVRFGHTCTGAMNAPSPEAGRGLECDKLSREALDRFWDDGVMAAVIKDLGPLAGKALNNALVDSYEMGGQNWTVRMREEFKARRGYDMTPYLPVLTGRVVESGEVSERFLWDFRRTIADLFADNYYTAFVERCHKAGLVASVEPYDGPFECMLTGRDADIPMGEFWVGGGESVSCRLAASVAHVYGRRIVGAEAFTADPNAGRWQNHPGSLKAVGDLMYTLGINRYIVHRYAHQPWMDKLPGMTMGQWGTHFERTNTWWENGAPAWVTYLTRCQAMLQAGRFCADVLYLTSDAAPNGGVHQPGLKAAGYDYDACNTDVLMRRLAVKDNRLVLPDGMSYRLLVLPETRFMAPATLARIEQLVQEGAVVLGAPPIKSPSLSGYPACDGAVRDVVKRLWAGSDGSAAGSTTVGKGRVVWGCTAEELLTRWKVQPDCVFAGASGKMAWIHREAEGAHFYFISNQKNRAQEIECLLRSPGGDLAPELWWPETGVMEPAPVWSADNDRVRVPLRLESAGSVFVVLRPARGVPDHFTAVRAPQRADERRTPTVEIRSAVYEAVDGAGGTDVTEKVRALVKSGETSIPASNGLFGDPAYLHVKRLRMEYTLNGKVVKASVEENQAFELFEAGPESPASHVFVGGALVALCEGAFELARSNGTTSRVDVRNLQAPVELEGAWTVRLQPGRGAPAGEVRFNELGSWSERSETGIKYFSGSGVYEKEFDLPELKNGTHLFLDLGSVRELAEVTLNGVDLGVWWKPPFAREITAAAKTGKNTLRVRVTNLWVNRLIGDEQFPDDCEWNGISIARWPEWMVNGSARPVKERLTFTTWKHYRKDSPLRPSGLLGPVRVRAGVEVN